MNIGFIGAGKVGFTLGKYFSVNGINIKGYYSRNPDSAEKAADFTDSVHYMNIEKLVSDCDTVFITVSDDAVAEIYGQIKKYDICGKKICHCSGSLSADEVFSDIAEHGAYGYSIHPLFPVSDKYKSYTEISDALFCIEGDDKHIDEWYDLFARLGNPVRAVSSEIKKKYHAACVISSNFVCGLVAESISLLSECGFSEEESLSALRPLAMNNISRIFGVGPMNALTGPVERCDTSTIMKHLDCLETESEKILYASVSEKLTELAKKRHPENDYSAIEELLKHYCSTN